MMQHQNDDEQNGMTSDLFLFATTSNNYNIYVFLQKTSEILKIRTAQTCPHHGPKQQLSHTKLCQSSNFNKGSV